jgi:hypothetical protein
VGKDNTYDLEVEAEKFKQLLSDSKEKEMSDFGTSKKFG